MFGRKKKETSQQLSHPILGEIISTPFLHTAKSFDIMLFGRKHTVFLYINSSEYIEKKAFTHEQEKAIIYFTEDLAAIERVLENQLKIFFENDDYISFEKSISLENITISSTGELAAFFNLEFSDEELTNAKSSAYFTDTCGIVVYPIEKILYNEEECYGFDS